MKKLYVFFSFLIVSTFSLSWAQLLVENFSYSVGQLTSVNSGANVSGGNWVNLSGTTNPLQVIEGSLSYPDYTSSGIGNKVAMINGTAEDAYTTFPIVTSGKVYVSFLVEISSTSGMNANSDATGDYFASFVSSSGVTTFFSRVCVRKGSTSNTYNLGLQATPSNSTSVFKMTDYSLATTHLVVTCYEIVAGSNNDIAKMWIDPSLSGNEPAPDLIQTSEWTSEISEISRFALRQGSSAVNANIDGIRIATSWAYAPVPVELSSFSAICMGGVVNLRWQTKTEIENYGFEIERSQKSNVKIEKWEKIGFVDGHGNSNSPKDYAFIDHPAASSKYIYRLKQIDNDGTYEFSKEVEVDLETPEVLYLGQNYPNPFNPNTRINYLLPNDGEVKLSIYTLDGEFVTSLANEVQTAGSYSIDFNGANLASGMYLYKLNFNDFVLTKKMILAK
ncbi:MAG: T9SS type A sorting domain-containing protein [Ignavibacteriaceae bacterium]|nr:T9SS type A sorting domain-containing protein [Ignavibacteriaceae bacterium]